MNPGVQFQDALARVASHRPTRRDFFERGGAALGAELSLDVVRALESIARDDLERYALSLASKRAGEFVRVVPYSLLVDRSLEARYREWVLDHPAQAAFTVLNPGEAEAIRALPFLRTSLARDPRVASYLPDLLAFETLGAASKTDRRVRSFTSRFSIHDLVPQLARSLVPFDVEPLATEYEFNGRALRWRLR